MRDVMQAILDRYDAYLLKEIPTAVADDDVMFPRQVDRALDHYLSVGRSAIDIIARAMVTAGRAELGSVLDLPSGAGRVTRHLKAFFPDAALFVGELNQSHRRFAAETFGAEPFDAALNFEGTPSRQFDLIFVGSLVTHFDHDLFAAALRWFIAALAPEGLLILTTHGRRHDHFQQTTHRFVDPAKWRSVTESVARGGFGFLPYANSPAYGTSFSMPSWVMRAVEGEPSIRIVGFQEAAWNDHQDVLVVQRRGIAG